MRNGKYQRVTPHRNTTVIPTTAITTGLAAASGLLLGLAQPPVAWHSLIWVALVPLLWIIWQQPRTGQRFVAGFLCGLVFLLIATRPLVSGYEWAGWHADTNLDTLYQRQRLALNILWLLISATVGLFWGAFAVIAGRLARGQLTRLALFAPPLLIVLVEWLRALLLWNTQWAFLGQAAIAAPGVIQLGALGGMWLLSWLVILVNVGVLATLATFIRRRRRQSIRRPLFIAAAVAALATGTMIGGTWRAAELDATTTELTTSGAGFTAAAVQYQQDAYTADAYNRLGMERHYLDLLRAVAQGQAGTVRLAVLPESIGIAALSLDGSASERRPADVQLAVDHWNDLMTQVIANGDGDLVIVAGVDTIEHGRPYNSLLTWGPAGLAGHYHKQYLVPFAESRPAYLSVFGLRGQSEYTAGDGSRVIRVNGLDIGAFICQEVLIPSVLRASVRDGARLLVSGGNDGVFGNPAVARVHADLARLRAVETGRYLVRAMKTGVSAVISPAGTELARSPTPEPFVAAAPVRSESVRTVYMRFGDWPLLLAGALLAATMLPPRRH